MKLKGNMVIELVDGNTGEEERIEEGNMVTNAVNDILGLNPMGIFYAVAGEYDTHLLWNDKLLPICPNMVGGILLYSDPLEEDADNIYPSTVKLPVAYAGNDVNATANVARGSLNLTESKALEDGYKFVWEFTPSQGNGTIAAVALTSALGGKNAYGSMDSSATSFLQVMETKLEEQTKEELAELYSAVEVDFGNNLMYSLTFADQSVIVKKKRLPVFTVGLNDRLDDTTCTLLEETAIPCSTFKFQGSYTPYGDFLDGHDGYWYGFSNSGNSSGNATVYWVKIKKDGLSMEEGVWTLSNVCIRTLGSFKVDTYVERSSRGIIRDGYLYTPAYDNTGIYKINLGNVADVTLIPFGFTSAGKSQTGSGTCSNYLLMVNDLIIGWDFQVKPDDTVVQTAGGARFTNVATPLFQYKEFLFGWGGNYGSDYRMAYLAMPYLASINNLGSAVVKNTDKTMKITYTLTEEP